MKNYLRPTLVISVMAIVVMLVSTAFAQRVGGYKEVSTTETAVTAAARFAVKAQAAKQDATIELVDVAHAERQIVAGTNYRMCLVITTSGEENEADVTITARVVVYRDLKGRYKLSSWVEEDCVPDDESE
ncbi:MAG: cystatin domain-containing protein [Pyrinomonadaceae bacterium]